MSTQFMSMLAYATAMPGPMRLRVRSVDGTETDHEVTSPFAIIGRGPGSHLQLSEKTVSFRHAYLQVFGPRVAYIDLLSMAGVNISGPPFTGWISPEHVVHIGGSEIRLLGDEWLCDESLPSPLEFRPRDDARPEFGGALPLVELELLNTPHKGMRWPINRVITLIGRDDRCRITVADDRLSRVQCGLVLLPSGLWVIDLMGKGGVALNGQAVSCGHIAEGAELTIGSYRLTVRYQPNPSVAPSGSVNRDFVTRSNRILITEPYHDTAIVYPQPEGQSFFFQDVHFEASRVCDLFQQRGFQNLAIDFSRVEKFPPMLVEGLSSICRSVPGRTVMCCANESTFATVQSSALLRIAPHFESLAEALQAIYVPA